MRTRAFFAVVVMLTMAAAVMGRQAAGTKPQAERKDVTAVRAVIEAQQAAWNRGDVVGYMEGYAKEDATTFVSGESVTRGWQTVLDRYKAHYATREQMGTLAFTELEFKPLCESYVLAAGRWELTRKQDRPHGRFTLIFRRTPAGWRIVHDHTSSAS